MESGDSNDFFHTCHHYQVSASLSTCLRSSLPFQIEIDKFPIFAARRRQSTHPLKSENRKQRLQFYKDEI